MRIDRRKFLSISAIGALSTKINYAKASQVDKKSTEIDSKIYTLGAYGDLSSVTGEKYKGDLKSVLTEISIPSGEYRQCILPLTYGHQVIAIGPKKILCIPYLGPTALIVDLDTLKTIGKLSAKKNFLFAGHGIVHGSNLYMPSKADTNNSKDLSEGIVEIFDIDSGRSIFSRASGGIWPHDLSFAKEGTQIVVGHTGENAKSDSGGSYLYGNSRSCLTVLDSNNLKVLKKIECPRASLSHLALDKSGKVYATSVQWLRFDPQGLGVASAGFGEKGHIFRISDGEYEEQMLSSPEPVIVFDLDKGELRRISTNRKNRRAVAIVNHLELNCIFVAYSHSDILLRINCDSNKTDFMTAFDMGLTEIRGLHPIAGTNNLIVGSKFRGLAVVDGKNMKTVRRIDIPLFYSTHLTAGV